LVKDRFAYLSLRRKERMVNLKQRLSEGDVSLLLRRSRNGNHKPLAYSKSCPVRIEPVAKVVKDTIGSIAESEKEVESARNGMECIIRREKRAIEDFERRSRTSGGVGTLRGWLTLKRETDKNRQAAFEDMKRAMEAVKVAENKVAAIGDRLEEEEQKLQERATVLRRKSCDMFKKVSIDKEKRSSTVIEAVEKAERANVAENGEIRLVQITSL